MPVIEVRQTAAAEALVRALAERYGRTLYAYALRLTGDRGAAEDIVQETLLRAWRHAHLLDELSSPLRRWLLAVARNLAVDRLRYRARHPEAAEWPVAVPVLNDHADRVVDSMTVRDAMATLPAIHRDVLNALYFLGRTHEEVADKLGIPVGTVKSRSHHGIRRLRELLAERGAAR